MRPILEIRLFGGFAVTYDGRAVGGFAGPRLRSLLAYLLLNNSTPQPRQHLAFLFWPDSAEAQARSNLRGALRELRNALPATERFLHDNPSGLQWRGDSDFRLDITSFQSALRHAAEAEATGDRPAMAAALCEAADLYAGDLLPDIYDEWVLAERERLREVLLDALDRLVELLIEAGRHAQAISYAQRLLRHDPLRETGYRHLINLYQLTGDRAASARVYQACVAVLQRELGVEPAEATVAAYSRLRAPDAPPRQETFRPQTPSFGRWLRSRRRMLDLTQEALGRLAGCATVTIRRIEAGAERPSRQLAEKLATHLQLRPEQVSAFVRYARGEAGATTLLPLEPTWERAATDPAGSLPAPTTAFVGRGAEVAAVRALLLRPDVRLLTLSGPPGIGKTRLAVEVATGLSEEHPDGVYFVPLAAITSAELVMPAIGQALGLREAAGQPLQNRVRDFLSAKQVLLLLDNFEHVIDAAPEVGGLLAAAAGLRVLVTSRERLRIYGEHDFQVPALTLPHPGQDHSPEALAGYEAVELFVQRARAARHDFALTAENAGAVAAITQRLDGLPLAIELAAARVVTLPPRDLAAWLAARLPLLTGGPRDLPQRHQTLRGAIAWSYDLLNDLERAIFRGLGVFAGGFTLAGAAAACEVPDERMMDFLDVLTALVAKSLLVQEVRSGEARFGMLETIREFALERLAQEDDIAAMRRRHALFFLDLAETAEPQLRGPAQMVWLDRLQNEHDNLHAALDWSRTAGADAAIGLRIAGALGQFWERRGFWSEGREQLAQLLELQIGGVTSAARARAVYFLGRLAYRQGDLSTAWKHIEQSSELFRQAGNKGGLAMALNTLGLLRFADSDLEQAQRLLEESLELSYSIGDKYGVARSLFSLGGLPLDEGDYARSRRLHEESLALFRELGDIRVVAVLLLNIGRIAAAQEDYVAAAASYQEALAVAQELHDPDLVSSILGRLGDLSIATGDYAGARVQLVQSVELARAIGSWPAVVFAWNSLALVALIEGDLPGAHQLLQDSLALARSGAGKYLLAPTLRMLGCVLYRRGDAAQAMHYLDESLALYGERGDKPGSAGCLIAIAGVFAGRGRPEVAAQLLGAVMSLPETRGIPLDPLGTIEVKRAIETVRSQLAEASWLAAYDAGRGLSIEEAAALAMAERPGAASAGA